MIPLVMLDSWTVLFAGLFYVSLLFVVATWGDRLAKRRASGVWGPLTYALSLGVYCTSWTYFGSVGLAARSGFDFLPIYLGPDPGLRLRLAASAADRRSRQAPEHHLDRRFPLGAAMARARCWAPWWRSSQ